jgi:hypothetical protein
MAYQQWTATCRFRLFISCTDALIDLLVSIPLGAARDTESVGCRLTKEWREIGQNEVRAEWAQNNFPVPNSISRYYLQYKVLRDHKT